MEGQIDCPMEQNRSMIAYQAQSDFYFGMIFKLMLLILPLSSCKQ